MRRFTAADIGPVPITPAMDPKVQAIFRAGNEGVHASQSEKRKRKERGKRFVWDDEDRYRLGKLANEVSNKEALKSAKNINPNANESTIRSFKKAYIIAIKANPGLSSVQRAAQPLRQRVYHPKLQESLHTSNRHQGKSSFVKCAESCS